MYLSAISSHGMGFLTDGIGAFGCTRKNRNRIEDFLTYETFDHDFFKFRGEAARGAEVARREKVAIGEVAAMLEFASKIGFVKATVYFDVLGGLRFERGKKQRREFARLVSDKLLADERFIEEVKSKSPEEARMKILIEAGRAD
ncbi:Uncharacterised protein [uncultured archaeon]|nr:Uncharacterised protein [uncultured archaeon]